MTTLVLKYLSLIQDPYTAHSFELIDTDYPIIKKGNQDVIVLFRPMEAPFHILGLFPRFEVGKIFHLTFPDDKFISGGQFGDRWIIYLNDLSEVKDVTDTFPTSKRELFRIKGKLGGDLSDERLEELKNSCDLLPDFQEQLIKNSGDIDNLNSQLNQTQSERDDYQNKWDNSQEELEQKEEIIRQLIDKSKVDHEEFKKALDKSKEWHERQKKDNLEFFLKIQTKQKELKELKKSAKGKLDINQKFLISTLLTSQEQVIRLEEVSSHLVSLNEKQLNKVKKSLSEKLTNEEINNLCSLQSEITSLEMKMEQMRDELQAKIEVNSQ